MEMKKLVFMLLVLTASMAGFGQSQVSSSDSVAAPQRSSVFSLQPFFGYLSYSEALEQMPQYYLVQLDLDTLRQQYEREMKRVEDEFNQKFEAFLEGRNNFPRTILLKRQTELQQLMQQNIEFRRTSQQQLQQAEREAMQPLRELLNQAIAYSARIHKVAFVLNTDDNACPFIDPALGINLQEHVTGSLATWGNAAVDDDENVINITGVIPTGE